MTTDHVGFDTPMPEPKPRFARPRTKKTPVATAAEAASRVEALQVPVARAPSVFEVARVAGQEQGAAEQRREDTGFLDMAKAAFMTQGVTSAILKRQGQMAYEPEPGFVVPEEALKGRTEDEREHLLMATSTAQLERFKFDLDDEREQQQVLGQHGMGWAVAASLFAGLPEGLVTGIGISKSLGAAGLGSLQAARAGETARAVGLSALENVGGNVAMTALEDALTNRVSAFDYGIAGGLGLIGAAVSVPGIRQTAITGLGERLQAEALARQQGLIRKAAENVGTEDGTILAQEVARLETEALRQDTQVFRTQVPKDRRVVEDLDALIREEEELVATAPTGDQATSDKVGLLFGEDTGTPGRGEAVLREDAVQVQPGVFRTGEEMNAASQNPSWFDTPARTLGGKTLRQYLRGEYGIEPEAARNAPLGVTHGYGNLKAMPAEFQDAANWIVSKYLGDTRILLGDARLGPSLRGDAWGEVGNNTALIRVDSSKPGAMATLIHELGHVVLKTQAGKVSPRMLEGFKALHADWLKDYGGRTDANTALMKRGAASSAYTRDNWLRKDAPGFVNSLLDVMGGVVNRITGDLRKVVPSTMNYATKYIPNFDEFGAEQFVKYLEAAVADELKFKPASISPDIVAFFKDMWNRFAEFFNTMKERGLLKPDDRAVDFFEAIRKANKAEATKAKQAATGKVFPQRRPEDAEAPSASGSAPDWLSDPVAVKYGIDLLPIDTPQQRAEARAILGMYKKAEDPAAPWNNIDPKFIDSLTSNNLFDVASTSLTMLKSENPVIRMMAAELIESPTGAAGRRSTAAISKHMFERKFMGNVVNDLQDHYAVWRTSVGGNVAGDFVDGDNWRRFNRMVAEEIEARQAGEAIGSAPAVQAAADVLEKAYETMRLAQVDSKTIGWAALPETSKGYMPHRMSPAAIRNASAQQLRALQGALVDQFVAIEGFDPTFADKLATKYIDRIQRRALGGHDAPANVHQVGAADIVQDALESMGMPPAEVRSMMEKYRRGGAGHTKQRLRIDLRQEHDDGAGGTFTLMDMFETDQLQLLRQQAQRVSGEVALVRHGVMGKPGLQLIRRAAELGDTGTKAQPKELEAFDQVAAELLGDPFGNAGGKWLNRAVTLTSLSRLGGMGFTQFAEYINGAAHVGVARTLESVKDFGRLRSEALALGQGKKVDNPIIGSLESYGGEFGTDAYKMVFPFDDPNMQYQVNGAHTLGMTDRLLRGGQHAQAKLSFWRAIHGAQQRGMAEQVVHKAIGFIRSGKELDTALKDMGVTAEVAAAVKAELPRIAKFEGDRLVQFDITKMEDTGVAFEFVQAVQRGSAQIIQGTFIGETGKWAHEGYLKLLTQFRTFSITSVEKQWGRQRANRGVVAALGLLMGSMAAAAPVYMARTYVQSVGRADQEKWLEERLTPERIARASLNYVAMSGLAGDFLDAFSSVSGVGKATGGRQGGTTEFVGTVVAPSLGLVDDLWRGVQNAKDGTDPHDLIKSLPFSKLPYLAPAINAMDAE